ncbi:diacylglycerol pyrophosphate phosphatase [Perkinsus olseni]|uniref:Diacylglycerol pyrophosphate phosphatase n=3 Tax=Perkinsus olseni TaxID=32597 RepID=A0A7J6QGF8_PEROL|nr:diacylglycerol pyrophosphate phosphatase [Perkinsus olseni]
MSISPHVFGGVMWIFLALLWLPPETPLYSHARYLGPSQPESATVWLLAPLENRTLVVLREYWSTKGRSYSEYRVALTTTTTSTALDAGEDSLGLIDVKVVVQEGSEEFDMYWVERTFQNGELDIIYFKMYSPRGLWKGNLSSTASPILTVSEVLPGSNDYESVDSTFVPGVGPIAVGLKSGDTKEDKYSSGIVYTPGMHERKTPLSELYKYSSKTGWEEFLGKDPELPRLAKNVRVARNERWAVWRIDKTDLGTSARRGELAMVSLTQPEAKAREVTRGAGSLGDYEPSPSGSFLAYTANYVNDSRSAPASCTHRLLYVTQVTDVANAPLDFPVSAPGQLVTDFGWVEGLPNTLWWTIQDAFHSNTFVRTIGSPFGCTLRLAVPCTTWVMAYQADGGSYIYGSDTMGRTPSLVAVDTVTGEVVGELPLPYDVAADTLVTTELEWDVRPGHRCRGMLYQRRRPEDDVVVSGPLVVSLHGGPCEGIRPIDKVGIYSRYRDVLEQGYQVLVPATSGTLGFGDSWSRAIIGHVGQRDVDEVASGSQYVLRQTHVDRVSLVGSSYGAYLALRSAMYHPYIFKSVVARYPWVETRWNGATTGDFTFEDELWAGKSQSTTWPEPAGLKLSDVLVQQGLRLLEVPLLLMHGTDDDICPVSNSKMLFNVLTNQVNVSDVKLEDLNLELVIFPGQRHGFGGNAAWEADARQLDWIRKFMPVQPERVDVPIESGYPFG